MSDTNETNTPPRRRRGILRSIRAKMVLILLMMAGSVGTFGYFMNNVLVGIEKNMAVLTEARLPALTITGEITKTAGHTKDNMIALMVATEVADINAAKADMVETVATLDNLIAGLDASVRADLEVKLQAAEVALNRLADARQTLVESDQQIEERVGELQNISGELRDIMTEMSQTASVELNKGAVNTYNAIDTSLKNLVQVDFEMLQLLLEARAELNLLAGTAVAFGGTKDKETLSRLTDIAESSDARLLEIADELHERAPDILDVQLLHTASFTLQSVIAQSLFPSETLRRAAMTARADTDAILAEAVASRVVALEEAAKRASSENGEALRQLMSNQVGFLNTLMEISTWVSSFQVAAINVLTSRDEAGVKNAAFDMEGASLNLSFYEDFGDARVGDLLKKLTVLNDPEQGLAAQKYIALKAQEAADEATQTTEGAVVQISAEAGALSVKTRDTIAGMAKEISEEVVDAEMNMYGALALAAVVFTMAFFSIQLMMLRPLNRISASTERLADGDRGPITGFERSSTEIFRIARSLSVFRDGIVEKEEMERLAEEERNHRMAAQNTAVAALGSGLSRLSDGDLTARIEEELAEGYEKLRQDFNRTLDTLNDTVGQVVESSSSIRNGASEISQASQDLSHRTESQAATLEQTAAALDQMTASVKSAAEGARDVERTTNEARSEAEASGEIVQNAVAAMTEIEQSSGKISQIISVIDDIAFQTNLLALNAGVEAARAGEAGRGFAVVASEVRGLAQRSSDAAHEIKTLISDSSTQVERGVDLVGKAGDALQSILQRVGHISELISNIATGSQEQSTGLYEINTGMSQLDQVTQQNAAMVEEATAAGQLLNSDAQKLGELVARFQTAKSGTARVVSVSDAAEPAPAPTSWGEDENTDWDVDAAVPVEAAASSAETDWSDFNWDEDEQATGTS
ncbi:HAMP domain-containing protein [Phaeobacter sp. B1627]|nr:methyl-accepting chemotaxis protein [Phaeobacter sp. B1627]TNJ44433.1 HAMP domain-containing protein [Phaeobacter sp. B1627]